MVMVLLGLPHVETAWREQARAFETKIEVPRTAISALIGRRQIAGFPTFIAGKAFDDFNGSHRLPSNLTQLLPKFVAPHWRQECHGANALEAQRLAPASTSAIS